MKNIFHLRYLRAKNDKTHPQHLSEKRNKTPHPQLPVLGMHLALQPEMFALWLRLQGKQRTSRYAV